MLAPCAYVYIIHFRYSLGKDFFENFLYFRNSRPPVAPPAGSVPSGQGQSRLRRPTIATLYKTFKYHKKRVCIG